MTVISMIVAADENKAIGRDNDMLCHLPNDLKYFKRVTEGCSVIMGRRTFLSLPKGALPNRRNIVITRNTGLQYPGCEMVASLDDALALCRGEKEIFVIGGGMVYREALDRADKIYLTRIHTRFAEADTFFPEMAADKWKMIWSEAHEADDKHKYAYTFTQWEKIKR